MFFLTFLTEPPGSWLYLFALLAALEAPAILALQQWRAQRGQTPSGQSRAWRRLAVAAWALLSLRAINLLFVLLIPEGTSDALAILPPLDRATATLTALVLVWALVYPQPNRTGDWGLLGLGVLTLGALALEWVWWPQALAVGITYFNGSVDDTLWVIAIVLVLVGGLWLLSQRRPPGWRAALGLLGVLLLGYAIDYLYPVAHTNAAGVARWGELIAVPLALFLLDRRARTWPADNVTLPRLPTMARARPWWWQVGETLLIAGVVYFALEFATGRYEVQGPSMLPNLNTGQYVLSDRLAYRLGSPQRGDVVTVIPNPLPHQPVYNEYVKRLMGLPGDTLAVHDGSLWINGAKIAEPYIAEPMDYVGSWTLGPDQYFVMGDNRNDSEDSHIWGSVHRSAITGKVVLVYWPPNKAELAPNFAFATP